MHSHLLNKPGISNIDKFDDPKARLIFLDESLAKLSSEELPEELKKNIKDTEVEIIDHTVNLTYDSYSFQEILRQILPSELGLVPNYEEISEIVYIRLPIVFAEHSKIIGEVILDKSGKKSVVGIFQDKAEIIAGNGDSKVEVTEVGINFEFDILKDPFSVGLESERLRLISKFEKNSVICDTCAGVGNLTLLAAKRGFNVISNSENQANYETLISNTINNRLDKQISAFNLNPVEFLNNLKEASVSRDDPQELQTQIVHYLLKSPDFADLPGKRYNHLILSVKNISDLEFLYGFFKNLDFIPTLHFYIENTSTTPKEDIIDKLNRSWMHKLKDSDILDVHYIREKLYCVSTRIPDSVAHAKEEILRSEGSFSDEDSEVASDLQDQMTKQMDFLKNSIRESELVQTSLLMSNLNSLMISQQFKRQSKPPESPSKRFKPR